METRPSSPSKDQIDTSTEQTPVTVQPGASMSTSTEPATQAPRRNKRKPRPSVSTQGDKEEKKLVPKSTTIRRKRPTGAGAKDPYVIWYLEDELINQGIFKGYLRKLGGCSLRMHKSAEGILYFLERLAELDNEAKSHRIVGAKAATELNQLKKEIDNLVVIVLDNTLEKNTEGLRPYLGTISTTGIQIAGLLKNYPLTEEQMKEFINYGFSRELVLNMQSVASKYGLTDKLIIINSNGLESFDSSIKAGDTGETVYSQWLHEQQVLFIKKDAATWDADVFLQALNDPQKLLNEQGKVLSGAINREVKTVPFQKEKKWEGVVFGSKLGKPPVMLPNIVPSSRKPSSPKSLQKSASEDTIDTEMTSSSSPLVERAQSDIGTSSNDLDVRPPTPIISPDGPQVSFNILKEDNSEETKPALDGLFKRATPCATPYVTPHGSPQKPPRPARRLFLRSSPEKARHHANEGTDTETPDQKILTKKLSSMVLLASKFSTPGSSRTSAPSSVSSPDGPMEGSPIIPETGSSSPPSQKVRPTGRTLVRSASSPFFSSGTTPPAPVTKKSGLEIRQRSRSLGKGNSST